MSEVLKELTEALGKETIDTYNTSDTRGNSPSYGTNYQKLGKELMSRDELAVLDGGKCILQLRGVRPFRSDKYDLPNITEQTQRKFCPFGFFIFAQTKAFGNKLNVSAKSEVKTQIRTKNQNERLDIKRKLK